MIYYKSVDPHLFNIISRKKEALKDEANQKDKVKYKINKTHLLRNEKVINTQRIWENDQDYFS